MGPRRSKAFWMLPLVLLVAHVPAAAGYTYGQPWYSYMMFGNEAPLPEDVPATFNAQLGPDSQSVKMFGGIGPIDGARFNPFGLAFGGGGDFVGPITPGDKLALDLNFDVNLTGGNATWAVYASLWSNEGFEEARILTRDTPVPVPASGQVRGVHLESNAFENAGDTGQYELSLEIHWTNFAPTDTLTLTIPDHSLDLTAATVPEPSALAVLVAAIAATSASRGRCRGRSTALPYPARRG